MSFVAVGRIGGRSTIIGDAEASLQWGGSCKRLSILRTTASDMFAGLKVDVLVDADGHKCRIVPGDTFLLSVPGNTKTTLSIGFATAGRMLGLTKSGRYRLTPIMEHGKTVALEIDFTEPIA